MSGACYSTDATIADYVECARYFYDYFGRIQCPDHKDFYIVHLSYSLLKMHEGYKNHIKKLAEDSEGAHQFIFNEIARMQEAINDRKALQLTELSTLSRYTDFPSQMPPLSSNDLYPAGLRAPQPFRPIQVATMEPKQDGSEGS